MINATALVHVFVAILGAPFLLGIANRVKARVGGRQGPPLLQMYYDIGKLLQKGAVYSQTTTWVFRTSPSIGLVAMILALFVIPFGKLGSVVSFSGDMLVLIYLFGLARFAMVLGAMDTGSSFEGMGSSREMQFAILVEITTFLIFAALILLSGQTSMHSIFASLPPPNLPLVGWAELFLLGVALLIVLLAENARIPVDDPDTHLELTMIHEVMVLDHGGIDLALIHYAASLKLWIMSALWMGLVMPFGSGSVVGDLLLGLLGMFFVSCLVGLVEAVMARLRLLSVPHLLIGASVLALSCLILILR